MGKQSRRKRERPPGEAKAHRYLARVGLMDRPDPAAYRRVAAADPGWFSQVCEADDAAVALAGSGDADPGEFLAATLALYPLLYRDLDTALAEYASRPVMIAAAWLRWWFEHHPRATRLLDVGCGPGVLTCAYGMALPDARVVGIDAVPEALGCVEELAGRLGVRNVSFVAGDLLDAPAGVDGDDFDQVVAVTALADAGVYPQHPPPGPEALSSVADVDGAGREFRSAGVDHLVERLTPGGSLLVFDRTPTVSQAIRLGAALVHAGIDLDLRHSGVEMFIEEGRPTTFTRFTGVRSAQPATTIADLSAWLKAARPPAYGEGWHDELRLESLKSAGARLLWGCEIDYAPHDPMLERREIWHHDDVAYGWVATTTGLRELVTGPVPEDLRRQYRAYTGRLAATGLQVRFYDHPSTSQP